MTIVLAAAWDPRGEMGRFQKLLPTLEQVYEAILITLPPNVDHALVEKLNVQGKTSTFVTPEWSWGRFAALQMALQTPATSIHYADFDRLLRWVETRPEEWRRAVEEIEKHDCLIIGRTESAYSTHPQALLQTEAISNRVASFLLGMVVDVSAGSKGFSRLAAEFIISNSSPGRALGTDAEWPVLLNRAGFCVDTMAVEGLDWESADRFQEQAASADDQQRAAEAYDADPQHWARRVAVAMEIVEAGLEAMKREIKITNP